MRLRIHRFLPATSVEGPGLRACIWVQGCSIRCPGCFNPGTWSEKGGYLVTPEELSSEIVATPGLEGVTFLGGEPFDQAEPLAELGRLVRAVGLSVMTFTGYEYGKLRDGDLPGWRELLAITDLLVDGRYLRSSPDHRRPWVGSTNQRFHFLSPRYRHLADQLESIPDRLEVRLRPDGSVLLNGMAPVGLLEELADGQELRRAG
jgi:anaerobic ribonucleoside-triphosphate reductase activating protein